MAREDAIKILNIMIMLPENCLFLKNVLIL